MDAVDPILIGFVGRLRRQPVNEKIFRRAAVLDAVAEIDFEAADPGYSLDSCQLRLAFLQRAMGPIAFVRNFLQMPPQPFGRCGLGKNVGTIRRGHARACSLSGQFHMRGADMTSFICCYLLLAGGRQL
jgi:hypothetical protein